VLSKRKLSYSAKNLSAAFQTEIDPLVNKVGVHEYQKDPSSLIYPMYLSPPNSSYQWASPSLVFSSYPDPAISSKLHPPSLASSNTSHMHRNFSQLSNWVWKMFELRTSQGLVNGEVGVKEN